MCLPKNINYSSTNGFTKMKKMCSMPIHSGVLGKEGKMENNQLISLTLLVFVVLANLGYRASILWVFLYLVFLQAGKCSAV